MHFWSKGKGTMIWSTSEISSTPEGSKETSPKSSGTPTTSVSTAGSSESQDSSCSGVMVTAPKRLDWLSRLSTVQQGKLRVPSDISGGDESQNSGLVPAPDFEETRLQSKEHSSAELQGSHLLIRQFQKVAGTQTNLAVSNSRLPANIREAASTTRNSSRSSKFTEQIDDSIIPPATSLPSPDSFAEGSNHGRSSSSSPSNIKPSRPLTPPRPQWLNKHRAEPSRDDLERLIGARCKEAHQLQRGLYQTLREVFPAATRVLAKAGFRGGNCFTFAAANRLIADLFKLWSRLGFFFSEFRHAKGLTSQLLDETQQLMESGMTKLLTAVSSVVQTMRETKEQRLDMRVTLASRVKDASSACKMLTELVVQLRIKIERETFAAPRRSEGA